MAKTSAINRNNKRRKMVAQFAERRAALKDTANDQSASMEERAYYRKLKVSRIALRELGSAGLIPGLVKSSW
jgi:small subunit ribosomal protein S14